MHALTEEEMVLVFPGDNPNRPKGKQVSLKKLSTVQPVVHYRRSLGFDRTSTIEPIWGRKASLAAMAATGFSESILFPKSRIR